MNLGFLIRICSLLVERNHNLDRSHIVDGEGEGAGGTHVAEDTGDGA